MRKTFLEKCINLRLCRVALVLLFLVPAISSLQANPSQNKTISGVVTSATDSEPLIGVSVQVRETATGGITDIDGRYSVVPNKDRHWCFLTSVINHRKSR